MKKVKQANGYIVYQATTQRDADNYNCQVGNYNIYIAQDIRDFGLGNSYPEYEDVDSLAVALVYCNGSHYAVAVALADELSSSTVQDMDLVLEIERRLDEGEALNTIRRCYDRENDRLYASISDAIDHGFDPYANGIDFDPYEDHPAMAYDEDGELHVVEDEDEWSDDDAETTGDAKEANYTYHTLYSGMTIYVVEKVTTKTEIVYEGCSVDEIIERFGFNPNCYFEDELIRPETKTSSFPAIKPGDYLLDPYGGIVRVRAVPATLMWSTHPENGATTGRL